MNQHTAIRVTKAQVESVMDMLAHTLGGDDEQLRADMIEGETDLHQLVSRLLAEIEDDEGQIVALKAQVDARKERKDRFERRIEARKAAITSLLDIARATKLALPEATLSVRTIAPRPKVVDADALPDAFVTIQTVRKPDMEAIAVAKEQGADIPGVVMTNGSPSLTVRRK